ncbi:DUF4946 domain-containing protein [Pseudomonas sp. nanlin1]|uniref:DUF4946 domain-containing protein n=1 Tax=Pseudomonas sp. nanlin1 TaxID=3040605 RepID=UPI0038905CBC
MFYRLVLLIPLSFVVPAFADDIAIIWPAGWEVENTPAAPGADAAGVTRQRATRNDANGDPVMVVELTRSPLQPGHEVNLSGVVLEMRKAVQINFSQGGYQSLCTKIHDGSLGNLPAMETTCKVTLNGNHVMTQTLVAAAGQGAAYGFSYAGSAAGYAQYQGEVADIRGRLQSMSQ